MRALSRISRPRERLACWPDPSRCPHYCSSQSPRPSPTQRASNPVLVSLWDEDGVPWTVGSNELNWAIELWSVEQRHRRVGPAACSSSPYITPAPCTASALLVATSRYLFANDDGLNIAIFGCGRNGLVSGWIRHWSDSFTDNRGVWGAVLRDAAD